MRIIICGSCIVVNGEGISKLINRGSIPSAGHPKEEMISWKWRKCADEIKMRLLGLRLIHVLKSWTDAIEIR
jgi:hypothetical protein